MAVLAASSMHTPAGGPRAGQLRSGVEIVRLDVTVLDSRRQPVVGLSQREFTVLEDGKEQPIVSFSEHRVPDAAISARSPATDRESSQPDAAHAGRVVGILMDDATLPANPTFVSAAKEVAWRIVDRLGPGDVAALLFTRDDRHAVSPTSDHARLKEAIDTFSHGSVLQGRAWTPSLADWELYHRPAVRMIGTAARQLAEVGDGQKVLVVISAGIPIDSRELGLQKMADPGAYDANSLFNSTREAFAHAVLGNVRIYAVDPTGLDGLTNYLAAKARAGWGSPVAEQIHRQTTLHREFLQTIARNTGGRAFINSNNPLDGVESLFAETSAYYLIGYRVPPPESREYRRVQVKVRRAGTTVIARPAYSVSSQRRQKK